MNRISLMLLALGLAIALTATACNSGEGSTATARNSGEGSTTAGPQQQGDTISAPAENPETARKQKVDAIRAKIQAYVDQVTAQFDGIDLLKKKIDSFKSDVKSILRRPRRERAAAYRDESLPALEKLLTTAKQHEERVSLLRKDVPTYDESILKADEKAQIRNGLDAAAQILNRSKGEVAKLKKDLESEKTRIEDLINGPESALFSKLINRTVPVKMVMDAFETRSIGCSDGKTLLYFDLNGSNLRAGRFQPILSFAQKQGADDSKRKVISSLLYGHVSSSGGVLKAFRFAPNPSSVKLSLDISIDDDMLGILEVKKTGDKWNDYPEIGFWDCEFYAEPYVQLAVNQNVIYDCDGDFSLHMNRPFNMSPVVQYRNEAYFFGNPGRCDDYYETFPPKFDERTDESGQSISKLEWIRVGGVLKYTDKVHYLRRSPDRQDYYIRHFESPAWEEVISDNPPASFVLKRTDAALWYSSDSSCMNSRQHVANHTCQRRK